MFWAVFVLVTIVKCLLIPAYRSTDFEVHRNWLAITHSLPLSKWYYDETSEWTLDYPPFFAYFEFLLSKIAIYFDAKMLDVTNLNYASKETILFQRISVIVTDVVFAFGAKRCITRLTNQLNERTTMAFLLLANFGLLAIDHIHFQYNGILFGILLLSIASFLEKKFIQSAFFFAVLLNMKHIFIYVSPVYVFCLLKYYCLNESKNISQIFVKFIKLGVIVLVVTAAAFGPFYNQIPQVLSRLFPFKRGLCHAYWAPNAWSLYNIVDKALAIILKVKNDQANNTGGLVQEYKHVILPSIQPITTFALTAAAMIPCCIKILFSKNGKTKSSQDFIRATVICACTSFMFGWHVHEKAILMVLIPLSLLATQSQFDASQFFFLSIVANYSLFPLLFPVNLLWIKVFLSSSYIWIAAFGLQRVHRLRSIRDLLAAHEWIYVFGFLLIFGYENALQYALNLHDRLPFMPLMLTSVYCSIGVSYFWARFYLSFLISSTATKSSQSVVTNQKKRRKQKQKSN